MVPLLLYMRKFHNSKASLQIHVYLFQGWHEKTIGSSGFSLKNQWFFGIFGFDVIHPTIQLASLAMPLKEKPQKTKKKHCFFPEKP
jgi:hypothetical protein